MQNYREKNKLKHTDKYYQNITGSKICKGKYGCKQKKDLKEFGVIKTSTDGFDYLCIKCRRKRAKKYNGYTI